jgi:cyclase
MRVVASLQITSGGAIKTRNFTEKFYLGDPVNIVRILNQKGAQEIAIFDIEATKTKEIKFDFIKSISDELNIPLSYGGGICNSTDIQEITNLGVERLVIGSLYHSDERFTRKLSETIGSSSLSASIDILEIDYKQQDVLLSFNGMQNQVNLNFEKLFEKLDNCKVGEIIIRFVQFDGQKNEKIIDLYGQLLSDNIFSKYLKNFQIMLGTGIYSTEILDQVEKNLPVDGVVLGSLVCLTKNEGVLISYPKNYSIIK